MAEFQVRPYESNLRSFNSSNFNVSEKSSSLGSVSPQTPKISTLGGSLKVQANPTLNSVANSESSVATETSRERIETKSSLLLFNSSTKLTARQELNDTLIEGVKQLKSLTTSIEKEVNPLTKQDLIDQADSLLSSLTSEFNTAKSNDPTITTDINITNLVKPGKEATDGDKFSNVSISKAVSLDDAGLTSVDFSDTENTKEKLDNALSILSNKKASYEGSSKQILGVTSNALSEFEAEGKVENSNDKAKDLSQKIVETTESILTPQENLESKTVEILLQDNKDEEKKKDPVEAVKVEDKTPTE